MCRAGLVAAALAAAAAVGGCDGAVTDPLGPRTPAGVAVEYSWELEGWVGTRPAGRPAAVVTWEIPSGWAGEPFRVYGRRAGGGYLAIATVTSCAERLCAYRDLNVVHGQTYDYFVVMVDERRNVESPASAAVRLSVPQLRPPPAPREPRAVALDNQLFLHWQASGTPDEVRRYAVYLVELDGQTALFPAGETDGTGFLDARAVNGSEHGYRIAAIDHDGHISDFSALVRGVPRPDFHAELLYSMAAVPDSSAFRFVQRETDNPVRSATAADAQWRLEAIGGVLHLRPLGATAITQGSFTTALTCGPGADAGCVAVDVAPATGYSAQPVPLQPEFTYVLRVTGDDARTHFGKLRVQHVGTTTGGRQLMIFAWAYQLRPDDVRLEVGEGAWVVERGS